MRHGGDIYGKNRGKIKLDFSVNLNPLGMSSQMRAAYRRAESDLGKYPDPECRDLRRAIARAENDLLRAEQRLSKRKGPIQTDQIVCGNGISELFLAAGLTLQKLCGRGCSSREAAEQKTSAQGEGTRRPFALIPVPAYSGYEYAMRAAGIRAEFYSMREEENFCLTERFLAVLRERAQDYAVSPLPDAILLCTPNNPTGRCVKPELLTALNDFCLEHRIYLFVDECYMALAGCGEGQRRGGARLFLQDNPYLVVLDAFTKTCAVPGLRLGYALCGDPYFAGILAECRSEWSVSIPAQAVGIAALQDSSYLRRARELIREERKFCADALRQLGMTVFSSDANFLLFRSEAELQQPLLERGILIRDCSNFRGLKTEGSRWEEGWEKRSDMSGIHYYRIGLRRHEENLMLMEALEEILRK